MYYYTTPNYCVALNAKVGSTSMARAIIQQFYPKADWIIHSAQFPPEVTEADRPFHWLCPGTQSPDKPIVLLVRDPVNRFVTACQQVGIQKHDIDSAISSLVDDTSFVRTKPSDMTIDQWNKIQELIRDRQSRRARRKNNNHHRPNKLRDDVHFFHQYQYAIGPTHCFRFPRDIIAAASFIGILTPFPENNKAKRSKPELSQQQQQKILDYYNKDKILFDSIIEPNYIYNP